MKEEREIGRGPRRGPAAYGQAVLSVAALLALAVTGVLARPRPLPRPDAPQPAVAAPAPSAAAGKARAAGPAGEPASPATAGPAKPAASAGPPPAAFEGRPDRVRGLYLTGYTAGNPVRLAELLTLAKRGGLNAMVIDAKDDDGRITWRSGIPLAAEIGADSTKIADVRALLRRLEENDIYPIARIVVFCDPVLSQKKPDWGVRVNGVLWRDRRRLTWTNPYRREVWEYNVAIAKEAARAGFREIQFDYVRFPEDDLPGVTDGVTREQRVGAISGFLAYAVRELKPLGVRVSADVFGLTTTVTDDMKIGQEYASVAAQVDYISPMVYPSHYARGNYGLDDPDAHPYETVYNSMIKAFEKTPELPLERHRPWIQDFSLRHPYGVKEVEAQIRALADAGIRQFLLWNPNNRYTAGVDYALIDAPPRKPLPRPAPQPKQEPAPKETAPAGEARTEPEPGRLTPNELGRIMVLEYHRFGPREERWTRTPANFRRDLEALYRRGYRPVNMADVAEGRIDLPRGYTPVVLTFDDGTEGQFRFIDADGRRRVDPDSAVGVLLDFHERHPDWPLRATFYVFGTPFEDPATWKEKVRLLRSWGMEVGNHTLNHRGLGDLDPEATAREVGGLQARLAEADPELRTVTLALPYGTPPKAPEAAKAGTFAGHTYAIRAFLLVGAGPSRSPHDRNFDPYGVPRIQVVDSSIEPKANFDRWLAYFDAHPEERYASDGDPSRVTALYGN